MKIVFDANSRSHHQRRRLTLFFLAFFLTFFFFPLLNLHHHHQISSSADQPSPSQQEPPPLPHRLSPSGSATASTSTGSRRGPTNSSWVASRSRTTGGASLTLTATPCCTRSPTRFWELWVSPISASCSRTTTRSGRGRRATCLSRRR
jgi:hypothetical protein